MAGLYPEDCFHLSVDFRDFNAYFPTLVVQLKLGYLHGDHSVGIVAMFGWMKTHPFKARHYLIRNGIANAGGCIDVDRVDRAIRNYFKVGFFFGNSFLGTCILYSNYQPFTVTDVADADEYFRIEINFVIMGTPKS